MHIGQACWSFSHTRQCKNELMDVCTLPRMYHSWRRTWRHSFPFILNTRHTLLQNSQAFIHMHTYSNICIRSYVLIFFRPSYLSMHKSKHNRTHTSLLFLLYILCKSTAFKLEILNLILKLILYYANFDCRWILKGFHVSSIQVTSVSIWQNIKWRNIYCC